MGKASAHGVTLVVHQHAYNAEMATVPAYIDARIRLLPPSGSPVLPGSTPVVAFGDVRKATVATLGLNPSKREFLAASGAELEGGKRRLQTLKSLHESDLKNASLAAVESVFEWCNTYFDKGHNGFRHNPYWGWFGRLEKVLKHINASFINGSACHLDLVQWATNPAWGDAKLRSAEKEVLLQARPSIP